MMLGKPDSSQAAEDGIRPQSNTVQNITSNKQPKWENHWKKILENSSMNSVWAVILHMTASKA